MPNSQPNSSQSNHSHSNSSETATVVELLPAGIVKVELENRRQVLAHAAGVREVNFVRLRPGDKVQVSVSSQDPTRGRITGLVRKS